MKLSISEKNRLKTKYGPWVLVTGASSGIGYELAERLGESGLNLVLAARSQKTLEEFADRLSKNYSIETRVVAVDLSESQGIEKLLDACEDLPIALLVAAAGFGTSGLLIESDLEQELNMLQVNCAALLHLTFHFGKLFAELRRGGIILLSSIVGFQGVPYAAHYAATKSYVQSLSEALSLELKPFGVDVLAAAPGPVSSGFGQRADMKMDMTLTPAQVGIPILKALGRSTTVLPGFLTKFLVYSLRTLPRWGKVRVMKKVMEGMTKHQSSRSKANA